VAVVFVGVAGLVDVGVLGVVGVVGVLGVVEDGVAGTIFEKVGLSTRNSPFSKM